MPTWSFKHLTIPLTVFALWLSLALGIFSTWAAWDDEGYIMLTLSQYLRGEIIYENFFTQYGPVFFQIMAAVFSFIPLNHDLNRLVTSIIGALIIIAVLRCAKKLSIPLLLMPLLAILVQHLIWFPLTLEPGHPQALNILLILVFLNLQLSAKRFWWIDLSSGAIIASLLLIKINVGALVGCWFIARMLLRSRAQLSRACFLTLLAFLPYLLTLALLDNPRVFIFATICSLAIFSLWPWLIPPTEHAVDPSTAADASSLASILVAGIGAIGVLLSSIFLEFSRGLSLFSFLSGTVLTPFQAMKTYVVLPPLDGFHLAIATSGLISSFLVQHIFHDCRLSAETPSISSPNSLLIGIRKSIRQASLLYIAGGLLLTLWLWSAFAPYPFIAIITGASFAWTLCIVPRKHRIPTQQKNLSNSPGICDSFRYELVILSSLLMLQAYPIAESQLLCGSILLPLIFVKVLATFLESWPTWTSPRLKTNLCRFVTLGVVVYLISSLSLSITRYTSLTLLDLPGARFLRLHQQTAHSLQAVSKALASYETFITLPGQLSFYFWTSKQPPEHSFLATTWMTLVSEGQQSSMVATLERCQNVGFLVEKDLARGWAQGNIFKNKPLVRYIEQCGQLVLEIDNYQILDRHCPAQSP